MDRVRAAIPGARAEVIGELTVKVTGSGLDTVSYLDNAYADYQRTTDNLEDIFARRISSLREIARTSDKIDTSKLIACVRGANFNVGAENRNPFARKRVVGDLYRYYCVDSKTSIAILNTKVIARLQRENKNPDGIALRNILRLSGPVNFREGEDVVLVTSGGNYEASLILVNGVWQKLTERLGSNLVFAVPNRDIFVVARASSAKAVELLKANARRSFSNGSYPVSRKIYRWRNGRISVLEN